MISVDDQQRRPSYLGLAGLLVGLLLGAVVLYATGPPHLPAHLPGWSVAGATLRGSSLPLGLLAYILSMTAWAVWLWIVGSLLLRVLVLAIDAMTHGAAWVADLRAISDRVTLPIVRRAVDGALVAMVVVNVASRTVSGAAAASPPIATSSHIAVMRSHATVPGSDTAARNGQRPQDATYTVQAGDTLWAIAQRFYGTGYEFPRLVAANVGRQMTGGERFTAAGVIQPGWVLRVPLPSQIVSESNGAHYYVVEEGDTLQGIAARLLGNEEKWTMLFEANRSAARLNGHVLTDPDLIWAGLRLKLPAAEFHLAPPHPSPSGHHPGPGTEKPRKNPPRRRLSPTPVEPTPTTLPPTPTPRPAAATSTPTASKSPTLPLPGDDTELIVGMAGAAAAAAGGAVLLAKRRVRRSLDEPPVPSAPRSQPISEFTEADPADALAHRLHSGEMEPITLLVTQVHRFLAESGVDDASVIWVQKGRKVVTMILRVAPQDRTRMLELARELGRHVGGKGRASVNPDHDVVLQLSAMSLTGLAVQWQAGDVEQLHLVPLGVLSDGQTAYGNWDEFGHVLMIGLPGGDTDVILTSLIASLAAQCRPEELRLLTIADHRTLPPQLLRLPHHADDVINPDDDDAVRETLEQLRRELVRRIRRTEGERGHAWRATSEEPEIVLVVGELANLPDDGTTLELIGSQGARHGVRLLVATARTDALAADVLSHFGTRVVLQTLDDDESIHLIGHAEAAVLTDGELYLRIDGRTPIRLRGFRISPEHLDELVRLMCELYGDLPPTVPFQAQRDSEKNPAWRVSAGGETAPGAENVDANQSKTLREPTSGVCLEEPPDDPLRVGDAPEGSQEVALRIGTEDHQVAHGDGAHHLPETADIQGVTGVPVVETAATGSGHQNSLDTALIAERTSAATSPRQVSADRPLIEVRCFGDFTVTSGDREIGASGEEGASFKAWEVLAFLAAQPTGAVAKEKILAAVWPDVDAERAGARLRTALTRLRALLAGQVPNLSGDVVRAERDGTRRLDTSLVTSDVHQFVVLLRTAAKLPPDEPKVALIEARKLYSGDLLSGRSAGCYEWVEERDGSGVTLREHYREEFYRATQRLARLYYQEEQAASAVPLYKELLKAEPTLEDVVRELYRCYQYLGDLTSLIREDRHLRQALREAYADPDDPASDPQDYQPEPETVALFSEIRRELEGRGLDAARGSRPAPSDGGGR